MKIIRITTDNEISIHEFPYGSYEEQNRILRSLIGPHCEIYEHVMPKRLYSSMGGSNRIGTEEGNCVSMLVDEEGIFRELEINTVGSYLYEADRHGNVILGNILIIGEMLGNDGIDFCGMSEGQFDILYPQLERLTMKAREMR